MGSRRFGYFIFLAFIAGTILLVTVQFNSVRNTSKLIRNNNILLGELRAGNHLREIDRDILGVESRIRASIATNDTSHLEGVDQKIDLVNNFLDSLAANNSDTAVQRLINRLDELALDKKRTKDKLMHRFLTLGNMNDTSSIANPGARRISNEITATTAKIYESRRNLMLDLSNQSEKMGEKARVYNLSILILLLGSGAIVCLFILRQFQKQHRLIKELNISEHKAAAAAQAKENFLANMSHEIRTPLSGILGFTNLLQKRPLDPTSAEFVQSIQNSGESLLAIINDILDLSKIEAGMMRITPAMFSVNGLVHSIETLFGERVKEKNIKLDTSIESGIPDTLIGDATRLTQILVNLIGNAIKFTDKGTISVKVYNKQRTADEIQLGFTVTDTGIGIDPKKVSEIFERFNQAEDSITRKYGGSGLGLSIVKDLVLLQQGNIEVRSEKGQGTTFDFYIPYTIAAEQLKESTSIDSGYLKDFARQQVRILIVDDNLINQSLLKHLLQQWNVSFDISGNGVEAIKTIQEKEFDIVLMDIQMPEMDGYTATQKIREDLKMEIPIIAMTAHAMAGEREKCLSRGMSEYISKPINETELFALIAKFGTADNRKLEKAVSVAGRQYDYINLDYLHSISNGDLSFEQIVLQQFIDQVPENMKQVFAAMNNNDILTVNALAHSLKSSVAIVGLLPLLEDKLSLLEGVQKLSDKIESEFNQIDEIITGALIETREYCKTIKTNNHVTEK